MICTACQAEIDRANDLCPHCGVQPLLEGRYRLEELVGQGALGSVFRAADLQGGDPVAVKVLPLVRAQGKAVELARREASMLRQLDHPCIPTYRDHLVRNRTLYLVQEFVKGETLAQELERHRYDQAEVLAIVHELLGTLAWLHGRTPPVVHRDVKPGNVIRRSRDGRLVLVDFGAVRDAIRDSGTGGSTVAGTFGYMAPEQFRGDASPATDIYGLGALAVALLSRQEPAQLMDYRGNFLWEQVVNLHPAVRSALESMLAPDPSDRPQDAAILRDEIGRLREGLLAGELPEPTPPAADVLGQIGIAVAIVMGCMFVYLLSPSEPPDAPAVSVSAPPAVVAEVVPAPPTIPDPPPVPEPEPAPTPLPAPTSRPDVFTLPSTGEIVPLWDETTIVSETRGALLGLATAELAYDAAFDEFTEDLERVGWEPGSDVRYYTAFWIDFENQRPLRAAITRGPGRGRQLASTIKSPSVTEGSRLTETELLALLAREQWRGNEDPWFPQ